MNCPFCHNILNKRSNKYFCPIKFSHRYSFDEELDRHILHTDTLALILNNNYVDINFYEDQTQALPIKCFKCEIYSIDEAIQKAKILATFL